MTPERVRQLYEEEEKVFDCRPSDFFRSIARESELEKRELVEGLKRLMERFEDKTGEAPHGNCGCTYCYCRSLLAKHQGKGKP
jgi:hypothetical protein